MFFILGFRPAGGQRRIRRQQVLPLEIAGVFQRGDIGFIGLDGNIRRFIGNRTGVILIAEISEVVAELMNEQIRCPLTVR